jgi:hypothetical protein
MSCKISNIVFKSNYSKDFPTVNHHEILPQKTSMDCNTNLLPGEFPFCGNCIHYPGPKVCPVANVSVDSTTDGTGCVMTGVYKKRLYTKDSVI